MLITVADFGVGAAIMTLVAHALAAEEQEEPRAYFSACLLMACAVACVLAAGGALVAVCIAPPGVLPAYLIAVLGVSINVPLGTAQAGWQALQRGWVTAAWDLLQTAFLVTGLFLAIAANGDARLFVAAAYGALLLANGISMASLLIRHPELRPTGIAQAAARLRSVIATGLRYFALTMLDGLSYMLDNVIALQLLGAAASARMLIAQRICVAALGLLIVIAQPLWPAFVDAAARHDRAWMARALTRGFVLVAAAAVAGSSIIVLWGPALLRLWLKADIGLGRGTLWIMAIWIVSLGLVRIQIMLLNALRVLGFQMAIFAVATLAALTLKIVLAPRFGVAGILFATAATFPVVILPAMAWRIARWRRGADLVAANEARP